VQNSVITSVIGRPVREPGSAIQDHHDQRRQPGKITAID
jgi:hypothetical protein